MHRPDAKRENEMDDNFENKFLKALALARAALAAGEIKQFDVTKDRHGYRYIMYEGRGGEANDGGSAELGGWNEWFNEAMEDEFSAEYADSWMLGACYA